MMVSLLSSLQRDMTQMFTDIRESLHIQDSRLSHVETQMGTFQTAHNEVIDTITEQNDDIAWLKAKVVDLEDRSRRNNLKFRGIPESVGTQELTRYIQQLMRSLIPGLSDLELVDRSHRLPKPAHLNSNIPRDSIARIHFFSTKEPIPAASRKIDKIPDPFGTVSIYSDLSAHTIRTRKELGPITRALQEHHILYKWGYPTKILITR